jgi:drug/metabolite transporter (DMT)-like permease
MSARAWTGFAALSLLWGVPYLFIKVAVDGGMSPAFVAWVRVVLAAVILLALAARAGVLPSLRGHWRWLALYALFEITIPFPLIAAGEQHVTSSLTAILIAAVPLFVALLAIRFDPAERATGSRLAGLLIGLAGVVVLMGIDVAGKRDEMLGAAAILVAALGYAAGPMVLKRKLSQLDPRAAMGASLAIAGVALTPFAALSPPKAVPDADVVASLVVLGVACTALAFVILAALITEIGPGRALVITYVNPVVAVALGVLILDERLGPGSVAGLLLIIAGSWLSTDGRLPPGLVGLPSRRRRRRSAAAQSSLSPAIRRSKPAGAWILNIRTGVLPWLVKPWGTPGGTSTNVPGGAATSPSSSSKVISPSRM